MLNGCVIRDRPGVQEVFDGWWAHIPGEGASIESVVNHVHLYDWVDEWYEDDDLPVLEEAAERIAEPWRLALRHQLPDRTVVVTVDSEPDEHGPTISCTQVPPAP